MGCEKNPGQHSLPLVKKLIYASGDLYGTGAMDIVNFYYLIFLTDIEKLKPSLAGLIFLISKAWDAFSDPLMGHITDSTQSRLGRRIPYFIAGSVAIPFSFFLSLVRAMMKGRAFIHSE